MGIFKGYRKYLLNRDTLFATIAVFLVIGLLALLPLNTGVLNPIKTALEDFDFNDLAYTKLGKNSEDSLDNRIVIVNIGFADRAGLARMIEKIREGKPKVIGFDVIFDAAQDSMMDLYLAETLANTPELVAASRIYWSNKEEPLNKGYFKNINNDFGYANFTTNELQTIRSVPPFEKINGKTEPCFSAAILKKYDLQAFEKLERRKKEVEYINFTRNIDKYLTIDGQGLLEDRVLPSVFKDKIVLMGYISQSPNDVEDKKFTPMNEKFAGKTLPDMNGVVVHANILSMMLDGKYVNKIPSWINWIITILIAWIHVALFVRYYIDNHIWFHLVAKIAQVISAIFFAFLSIRLFTDLSIKIDMAMPIVVIVLAIDVIYFYEAFAVWMHKKFGFNSAFVHNKHH
ncbi:MAG TPA: CHASE2 domain-containing protein [Chitinophagaceae bacterium]